METQFKEVIAPSRRSRWRHPYGGVEISLRVIYIAAIVVLYNRIAAFAQSGQFQSVPGGPEVSWQLDQGGKTITTQLRISGQVSWISVGFSPALGSSLMNRSDVAIGLFSETPTGYRVQLNEPSSEDRAFRTQAKMDSRAIRVEVDKGISILTFTRPLSAQDSTQVPVKQNQKNVLVWAWRRRAPAAAGQIGRHEGTGSGEIVLQSSGAAVSKPGVAARPVADLSNLKPQGKQELKLNSHMTLTYFITNNELHGSVKLLGEAWVSIGFSDASRGQSSMVPSDAVIGTPSGVNIHGIRDMNADNIAKNIIIARVGKFSQSEESTVMKFIRPLSATGLKTIAVGREVELIWAYGLSNQFQKHRAADSTKFILGGMCQADDHCPRNSECSSGACQPKGQKHNSDDWIMLDTPSPVSIRYRMNDEYVDFDMIVLAKSWISMGLSKSGGMISDWAVVCIPTSTPTINEYRLVQKGSSAADSMKPIPDEYITKKVCKFDVKTGKTRMTFRRPLADAEPTSPLPPIMPSGSSAVIFAYGTGLQLGPHAPDARGEVMVEWQEGTSLFGGGTDTHLERTHGALMVIAWLILVPGGIFVARFFHDSDGVWFGRHKLLMLGGLGSAVLSWILIMVSVSLQHGAHFRTAHGQIGLIVMIVSLIQPVLAIWRNIRRAAWENQHRWTGRILYLLAFINCFLGTKLLEAMGSRTALALFVSLFGLAAATIFVVLTLRVPLAEPHELNKDENEGGGDAAKSSDKPASRMPWSPTPSSDHGLPDWATSMRPMEGI